MLPIKGSKKFCSKETYLTCSPKCFPYLFIFFGNGTFYCLFVLLFIFLQRGCGEGAGYLFQSHGTGFYGPHIGKHCPGDKRGLTGPENFLCHNLHPWGCSILASWASSPCSLLGRACCKKVACPWLGLRWMWKRPCTVLVKLHPKAKKLEKELSESGLVCFIFQERERVLN